MLIQCHQFSLSVDEQMSLVFKDRYWCQVIGWKNSSNINNNGINKSSLCSRKCHFQFKLALFVAHVSFCNVLNYCNTLCRRFKHKNFIDEKGMKESLTKIMLICCNWWITIVSLRHKRMNNFEWNFEIRRSTTTFNPWYFIDILKTNNHIYQLPFVH